MACREAWSAMELFRRRRGLPNGCNIACCGTDRGFDQAFRNDYGGGRLDLEVGPGEVFGFLGPNGAGKSTTIRLLLGLARPTAGRAWIFGIDAADGWRRTGWWRTCRRMWRCGLG